MKTMSENCDLEARHFQTLIRSNQIKIALIWFQGFEENEGERRRRRGEEERKGRAETGNRLV